MAFRRELVLLDLFQKVDSNTHHCEVFILKSEYIVSF